jgi:hypothetical protein
MLKLVSSPPLLLPSLFNRRRCLSTLGELRSELEARTMNLSKVKSELLEARAAEGHIRERVLAEAEVGAVKALLDTPPALVLLCSSSARSSAT